MRRFAILIRDDHPLDEDVRTAIVHLRAAGIEATEEKRDATERIRRFIWLQRNEDTQAAALALRAAGIRCS
jgi:hypothetical protein